MTTVPPTVFISYSHKDEGWKDRLVAHLGTLKAEASLDIWEDRRIGAGADWLREIQTAMDRAAVAVLLVSTDFLNSRFITETEVPHLLKRRKEEGLRIVPLFVRPCAWQTVDWIEAIQGRPKDAKPLSGWNEHEVEQILVDLALEIRAWLKNGGGRPVLRYDDEHTRDHGERLEMARHRFKELSIAGQSAADVQEPITAVPPTVFISYSHKDEVWKNRLVAHLRVLGIEKELEVWDDRRIEKGTAWLPEIQAAMDRATVALLLISKDFLTSGFIRGTEVPHLLQRRSEEGLRVIPLFVHPCAWKAVGWIADLQGGPPGGKALSGCNDHDADQFLTDLALEIRGWLKNDGGGPVPRYEDDHARELGEKLKVERRRYVSRPKLSAETALAALRDERRQAELELKATKEAVEMAQRRRAFLAEASEILSESLDYEATLASLVHLTVPRIADDCVFFEVEERRVSRRITVAHVDPAKEPLLERLSELHLAAALPQPLEEAVRSGRPRLDLEVSFEGTAGPLDAELREIYRRLGRRSSLILPLVARGQILGALFLATSDSGRTYGLADLALGEELARRAAVAVGNARQFGEVRVANDAKDQLLATLSHELRTPPPAKVSAALPLPKVFVSYSHDSPEHMDRVLALCDRLREDGIEAWIDQYETSPAEGWPRWCARRVVEADFVVVVCTEVYERRFRGAESPGEGLGARWEGYVAVQELYDAGALNEKYVPVLWPPAGKVQIPLVLRGATRYDLGSAEGYENLYRHLTGQAKTPAPKLGRLVPMPPKERRTRFSAIPEPRYEDEHTRELGEKLAVARRRFKELTIAGQSVGDVREQVLGLRRAMREGGRLQPGDQLDKERFELLEVIGRGGFAIVWKAWDEARQEVVAVKVLHGLHAEDRTRRERFFRGARKMAELRHPGIVRVIETELEEAGKHFFVMDYVGGGDLRRAVLAGELPQEKVLPILLAVGEALAFSHAKGVIHRDVKPANILLDGGRPKLTDFDLVRAFDTTGGTQTQGHLGTMVYSAPEMLGDAKNASAAADVYSLAMTAVFAFYGKDLPLDVLRRPEAFLEKLPCSPALQAALSRGISWEPEDRPGSVAALCEEVRLAAGTAAGPTADRKGKTRREPAASEERRNEVDGTVLLYVPGGEYTLGAEDVNEAAKPIHRVVLSPFWIAKYPVTNEQYRRFMDANKGVAQPAHWSGKQFNQPEQPVVGVSWDEAQAYCQWAGLCLPSEAQWEASARGTDGRRYPWGGDDPPPEHANFGGREGRTTPVGTYPKGAGPFGTLDQTGNVWEWCEDVWNATAYREREGRRDPLATTGETAVRCLRGGSWSSGGRFLAVAFRYWFTASDRNRIIGFRCLLPAGPSLDSSLRRYRAESAPPFRLSRGEKRRRRPNA